MAAAGSAVASYAFAQVEAHFRRGIRIDGERPPDSSRALFHWPMPAKKSEIDVGSAAVSLLEIQSRYALGSALQPAAQQSTMMSIDQFAILANGAFVSGESGRLVTGSFPGAVIADTDPYALSRSRASSHGRRTPSVENTICFFKCRPPATGCAFSRIETWRTTIQTRILHNCRSDSTVDSMRRGCHRRRPTPAGPR